MQLILGMLVLAFVVGTIVLYYALRFLALRTLPPTAPGRALAITPTGFAFYGCLVLALIVLLSVAGQSGGDTLRRILHRPGGLVLGIAVLVTLGAFIERALRWLGYPSTRAVEHRDV